MQDTSTTPGTEHGILSWAGIAITAMALARPVWRFLSWLFRHLFLLRLEQRLDRLESTTQDTREEVRELHPKMDAMARALQRMEVRGAHDGRSSIAEDPEFPIQVSSRETDRSDLRVA
jgi:hypothetical protein